MVPGDEVPPEDDAMIISGAEALADQALAAHEDAQPGDLSLGLAAPEQEFLVPAGNSTVLGVEGGEVHGGAADSADFLAEPSADPEGSGGLSVEELLGEAVAAEAALLTPSAGGVPAPQVPTFQLHMRGFKEELRPALKKLLEAQGLALPEKNAGVPIVSQLTEFQAAFLLQGAHALGVETGSSVVLPGIIPTEDELALGELLSASGEGTVADVLIESAPSVELPKTEKDVLLCSPTVMPGLKTRESFGIIVAHRSIARRLFREEELREKIDRELKAVPGRGSAGLASSHLQQILRDLFLELRKAALAKGANSVLGVKLEAFPESSTQDPLLEQLRLVAFGTAALVEKT